MSSQPPPPQLSPDGKFYYDWAAQRWVPNTPGTPSQPVEYDNSCAQWMSVGLTGLGCLMLVTFSGLAIAAFVYATDPQQRLVLGLGCLGFALISVVPLGIGIWSIRRSFRRDRPA